MDGPVVTGRVTDLDLVSLTDRSPLSSFSFYVALAPAVHHLISWGGAESSEDPYEYILQAGNVVHYTDGSCSPKPAEATNLIADKILTAYPSSENPEEYPDGSHRPATLSFSKLREFKSQSNTNTIA